MSCHLCSTDLLSTYDQRQRVRNGARDYELCYVNGKLTLNDVSYKW